MTLVHCGQFNHRPRSSRVFCLVMALVGALCTTATADDPASATPQPEGTSNRVWLRQFPEPAQPVAVNVIDDRRAVSVFSEQFGKLIQATSEPLFSEQGPLNVTAEVQPAPDGFNVVYVINNPTDAAQRLPRLQIDGHRLEDRVQWLSHRMGTTFTDLQWMRGKTLVAPDVSYPRILYAPVMVARDSRVALGIALHYPIMQYAHGVRVFMYRNAAWDHWQSVVRLDGQIDAGQTRTYIVSVRYALPEDWIHTLKPYRDYLHSLYGSAPRYTQDLRPVLGRFLAYNSRCSAENPRGFDPQTRPDLNGWGKEVDGILGEASRNGFERVMVWMPSGAYWMNPKNNFPPTMMREWTSAMEATASQWHRIPDSGIELGFWWGRATEIADHWDDDVLEAFDPGNPHHVFALTREYQLAVARGAACVGLDSFRAFPPWQAVPWLAKLRDINDQTRFIGEPMSNDVMHMHIPQATEDIQVPTPPLLADYLVPGREIWVLLKDDEANLTRARQVVGWGMTVLVFKSSVSAKELAMAVRMAQRSVQPP